jgi:hypothetical protein
MIIEFPMLYEAQVILKGKRNPEKISVVEMVPFEIREVEGRQVPICVTVAADHGQTAEVHYRNDNEGGYLQPYNVMMRPLYHGLAMIPAHSIQADFNRWSDEVCTTETGQTRIYCLNGPGKNRTVSKAFRNYDINARTWLGDTKTEAAADLQAFAAKCVITDGHLYVPSAGPMLSARADTIHISEKVAQCRGQVTVVYESLSAGSGDQTTRLFPIDRPDQALEWAGRQALTREAFGKKYSYVRLPPVMKGRVEISGPLPAGDNGATLNFQRGIQSSLSLIHQNLQQLDSDGLRTFADFRDAVSVGDTEVIIAVGRHMAACLDVIPKSTYWPFKPGKSLLHLTILEHDKAANETMTFPRP